MVTLENKKMFRSLVDFFPLAAAITDMKMAGFVDFNDRFCDLLKYSRAEILNKTTTELGFYSEQDRKRFIHELNLSGEINGFEKDVRLKDSRFVSILMFARLISNGGERYVLSLFHDMTEKKHLQAQVQQKEKNEVIGTLAGGIAHEFNNALAGILGNMELLEMALADNDEVKKHGEAIKASIERMTRITDQLLAYARGGKYDEKIISLSDLFEEMIPDLNQTVGPFIRLEIDLQKNMPRVKADCSQIQTVLSGILMNAREALDEGGRIRISTREVKIEEKFTETNPWLYPGLYVRLSIEDEGKGMDKETKKRIFEPFFSTKFHGRGLGMAAAYGIVRNHGGGIYVDSEIGKGTRIYIYLPAIEEVLREIRKPMDEKTPVSGTILVIEDEDRVLEMIRTMLTIPGYRILEAKNGQQAVEIAEDLNVGIDLALLDIRLPDMKSVDIYLLIKKDRPNLKVIVCSDSDMNGPAREILDAGAEGFIRRPFTFETLFSKIREFLERRRDNRFKVVRGTITVQREDHLRPGQLIDISRGGIAFWYDEGQDMTKEFAELAIGLASEDFYLDKIPCKLISYCPASDIVPINDENLKRVGVQLGALTQEQADQLEYFIRNYTIEKV